jgi:C-terminal processing protease CtpA/Prc
MRRRGERYGLATIVGEPVNSAGKVYTETTPGIGLRAYLTTKVFLSPKPHPDGQGVVPDIAVATTPADIAAGPRSRSRTRFRDDL